MAKAQKPQDGLEKRATQVAEAKGVSQSQARREAFRKMANEQAKGGNG